MKTFALISLLTFGLFSCQRKQESRVLWLPQGRQVALLHGMKAAQVLLHDPHYQYFERVSLADLSTQLKQPTSAFRSREDALAQYKEAIQTNIRRFTTEEAELLEGLLQQACRLIHHIDPTIFPRKLALVKVTGRLMGPEVLYTRGQAMVIPQKVLNSYSEEKLLSFLVRGLYFLYIREHPHQQQELYALLKFKPLPHSQDSLQIPREVRERISLSPNTGPLNYYLHLATEGVSNIQRIYPLSSTAFHNIVVEDKSYAQKSFALYSIDTSNAGHWSLKTNPEGHSTLFFRDFYYQLRDQFPDQTISLVHPDLSLADQFVRVVLSTPLPEDVHPSDAMRIKELQEGIRAILAQSVSPKDRDPS